MSSPNSALSQLYIVDGATQMAVSEQPSLYNEVMIGYKAVNEGKQTITLANLPDYAMVELIDDNTDERVFMGIGDSYSFVSDAGTYNNRFRLRLTDITGIKYSEQPADDIKVVVEGDEIRLYGTDKGGQLSIYTVNGMLVDKINTSDCVTVYTTTLRGVIIIKLGVEVFKVFKL
jgi:hypothetical protein